MLLYFCFVHTIYDKQKELQSSGDYLYFIFIGDNESIHTIHFEILLFSTHCEASWHITENNVGLTTHPRGVLFLFYMALKHVILFELFLDSKYHTNLSFKYQFTHIGSQSNGSIISRITMVFPRFLYWDNYCFFSSMWETPYFPYLIK